MCSCAINSCCTCSPGYKSSDAAVQTPYHAAVQICSPNQLLPNPLFTPPPYFPGTSRYTAYPSQCATWHFGGEEGSPNLRHCEVLSEVQVGNTFRSQSGLPQLDHLLPVLLQRSDSGFMDALLRSGFGSGETYPAKNGLHSFCLQVPLIMELWVSAPSAPLSARSYPSSADALGVGLTMMHLIRLSNPFHPILQPHQHLNCGVCKPVADAHADPSGNSRNGA